MMISKISNLMMKHNMYALSSHTGYTYNKEMAIKIIFLSIITNYDRCKKKKMSCI